MLRSVGASLLYMLPVREILASANCYTQGGASRQGFEVCACAVVMCVRAVCFVRYTGRDESRGEHRRSAGCEASLSVLFLMSVRSMAEQKGFIVTFFTFDGDSHTGQKSGEGRVGD